MSVYLTLSKITSHCLHEEPPPPQVNLTETFDGDYDVTEITIKKVPDYKGKIR